MKSYFVLHEDVDRLVIEAECDNFADAVVHLSNSIYMDPFIVVDDGEVDFERITPAEARRLAIRNIIFERPAD